jgi:hypothetical protein
MAAAAAAAGLVFVFCGFVVEHFFLSGKNLCMQEASHTQNDTHAPATHPAHSNPQKPKKPNHTHLSPSAALLLGASPAVVLIGTAEPGRLGRLTPRRPWRCRDSGSIAALPPHRRGASTLLLPAAAGAGRECMQAVLRGVAPLLLPLLLLANVPGCWDLIVRFIIFLTISQVQKGVVCAQE